MKEIEFEMSTELIKKMLQGLEVQFVSDDVRVRIYPPQRGIFFTHEELKRLQSCDNTYIKTLLREIIDAKFSR